MATFKFVHASDLHLGSPFRGLRSLATGLGGSPLNAGFDAFDNILRVCVENKADFLLVAGDVFDAEDRGLKAQIRFRDGLAKLAQKGVQSFVVHGNHDPLSGWAAQLDWAKGVGIFKDRVETIPVIRNGETICHIQGISYPNADVRENLALKFKRPDDSPFAIALLHANLGTNTGHDPYAPCSLNDLVKSGFDYWALGHVHAKNVIRREKPAIVYPGNPQGLHINESGERGVFLISVSHGVMTDLSFIPTDVVRWRNLTGEDGIDVSAIETEEALLDLIDKTCGRILTDAKGRSVITRMELKGRCPLHSLLSRERFLMDLTSAVMEKWIDREPFLFVERIIDKTRRMMDLETRRKGSDFVAEVLEVIDLARKDKAFFESLTKEDITSLYNSRGAPIELSEPSPDELLDSLNEAESLLVDRLIGEESS